MDTSVSVQQDGWEETVISGQTSMSVLLPLA